RPRDDEQFRIEHRAVGIEHRSRRFAVDQPRLLRGRYDADDREGLARGPDVRSGKDAVTQSARAGPVVPREVFVDDGHPLAALNLGRIEEPSLDEREAHRLEVARSYA